MMKMTFKYILTLSAVNDGDYIKMSAIYSTVSYVSLKQLDHRD